MQDIASRCKQIREKVGISIEAAAFEIGCTPTDYMMFEEHNTGIVKLYQFEQLARLFRVRVKDIIEDTEHEYSIRGLSPFDVTAMIELQKEIVRGLSMSSLLRTNTEQTFRLGLESGMGLGLFDKTKLLGFVLYMRPFGVEAEQLIASLPTEYRTAYNQSELVNAKVAMVLPGMRGCGFQVLLSSLLEEQAYKRGYRYAYTTYHPENISSKSNKEGGLGYEKLELVDDYAGSLLRYIAGKPLNPGLYTEIRQYIQNTTKPLNIAVACDEWYAIQKAMEAQYEKDKQERS